MRKASYPKTATQDDVRRLAQAACDGDTAAVRAFADLARRNGFEGRAGGWIYRQRTAMNYGQGWKDLAHAVHIDGVRMAAEAVLDEQEREDAQREQIRAYDDRRAELAAKGRRIPQAADDAAKRAADAGEYDRALMFLRPDVLDDFERIEQSAAAEPVRFDVDLPRLNAALARVGIGPLTAEQVREAGMNVAVPAEPAAPGCASESFASGHPFIDDRDRAGIEPGWPEGYELCGKPADHPIHVGDEWTEPTWLETPTPPVDPDAADRAELLAHDAARPKLCVKIRTLTGRLCRQPVEYVAEGGPEVSGWYHIDRSLTADHHAVPNDWA